jgi:hypothetical protein
VQQRAGDESLADLGVGAGDEPGASVRSSVGVGENHVVARGQASRRAVRFVGGLHLLPGMTPEQAAASALADRVGADVLDRAQQGFEIRVVQADRLAIQSDLGEAGPDQRLFDRCRLAEGERVAVAVDAGERRAQFSEGLGAERTQRNLPAGTQDAPALRRRRGRGRTTARSGSTTR